MRKEKAFGKRIRMLILGLLLCLSCMNVTAFAKQSTQFNLYVAEDAADDSDKKKEDVEDGSDKKKDGTDNSDKKDAGNTDTKKQNIGNANVWKAGTNSTDSVKTGEEGGQAFYLTMAILAGGGICLIYGIKKERGKKN